MASLMNSEVYTYDNLMASDDYETVSGTLISGQNLKRGSLLGKITASGKYTLSISTASDGSQNPDAILVKDTDASGGDATCEVYVGGEFNTNAMTFGSGITAAASFDGLRQKGIVLKSALQTPAP